MRRPAPAGRCRRSAVLAGGLAGALALAGTLTGDPAPVRRARSDPGALGLLRAAADAARRVPYEGRRFLTTGGGGRAATARVLVSHTPGAGVRYRSGLTGEGYRPESSAGDTTGFTPATLALLTRNYAVVRAADASICGRAARVVEARRADGSPAGRFWIDRDTGLMLHRELIDATGRPVITTGFTEISFTVSPVEPSPSPARSAGRPASPGRARAAPSRTAGRVPPRARGARSWTAPPSPGCAAAAGPSRRTCRALTLHEARRENGGGALHLSYSDGLAAVSVFVQRGDLDARGMAGWQKTARRGRTVYRRESLRRWAVSGGNGYVYTVVTDAPQSTATAVALNMPRDSAPFWARLSRGARRLVAAVNPFD
ncbi:MucB/RseB C-terminal domain-containing protein [Actinomadura luteofluorescens]|uniref:MucB/RseB C-terminal domain-containing protein n=1 Tax=Actinomadura luteofluorescens TaxID=46163 RepID=UPI00362C5277